MRTARWLMLLSVIALGRCHESPTEPTAPMLSVGKWAGPQIEVTVSETQVVFTTTTCVHGTFARPEIHSDGTFVGDGTMEPMSGPPPPPPLPHAVVNGVVRGNSLIISAIYDNGLAIGPFTATYSASGPTFYPCPV